VLAVYLVGGGRETRIIYEEREGRSREERKITTLCFIINLGEKRENKVGVYVKGKSP